LSDVRSIVSRRCVSGDCRITVIGLPLPSCNFIFPCSQIVNSENDGFRVTNTGVGNGLRAIGGGFGVFGVGIGNSASGVQGVYAPNSVTVASGVLGCKDPVFHLNAGVYGEADQLGVIGHSTSATGTGTYGHSTGGPGVRGETQTGVGVQGQAFGDGLAARFIGDVEVTGDIRLVNADCAEEFDAIAAETIDPGTVMVIDGEDRLRRSEEPYDKRVAGIVAGGGNYRPGIVLDKNGSAKGRLPISMLGKVFCKVDASYSSIEVGDLLTTSATPGCAMKALDPARAFGAVVGKALRRLEGGRGLIPILIALQ
jgi:hypothetical protein